MTRNPLGYKSLLTYKQAEKIENLVQVATKANNLIRSNALAR